QYLQRHPGVPTLPVVETAAYVRTGRLDPLVQQVRGESGERRGGPRQVSMCAPSQEEPLMMLSWDLPIPANSPSSRGLPDPQITTRGPCRIRGILQSIGPCQGSGAGFCLVAGQRRV